MLWIWFFKSRKNKRYFFEIILFLSGISISLLPWFTKNIIEIYPNISVSGILKWDANFKPDLEKIYSPEQLEEKNREKLETRKKDAVTINEDLKRYLWYESWMLPYTNMAWNLTMQKNQWWKFTEISFVFFALIPLIFIFLPFFRNKYFYIIFIIFAFFELFLFIKTDLILDKNYDFWNIEKQEIEKVLKKNSFWNYFFPYEDLEKLKQKLKKENIPEENFVKIWEQNRNLSQSLKDFLASINLPLGYFVIFLIFIIPCLVLNYFIKNNEKTFIFRVNLVFATIYIFFWCISSFSIAWYGITMYFCLLLMIWFGSFYISKYSEKNKNIKFFGSLVLFLVFFSFLIFTSIPHSIENLKAKNYVEYKTWKKTFLADTFDLHNSYEKIFFELNVSDAKKQEFLEKNISENILKDEFFDWKKDISQIIDFLKIKAKNGDFEARSSLENIYRWILHPEKYFKNEEKIFRIWTFLKYYISDNNKRVFDDSLVFYFYDYILNEDTSKTWENMKNLWFKYLLVDIWTATIDDSESHFLTKRYEELLKNLKSEKLELIYTDSICLRFAKDLYKIEKNDEKFLKIASIWFDSFDEKSKIIWRKKKLLDCSEEIEKFVKTDFDRKIFYYLKNYKWESAKNISEKLPKSTFAVYKIN